MTRTTARIKRAIDVVGSAALMVVLSPVMLLTAVVVRLSLGSPVLFWQTRPGLHGRPFELVKFRTMTDDRDVDGSLARDEDRMTPVGAWLRSTSLDELPELWNVLRGDMSLVGPRPLLMEYLPLYTPEQRRRHDVRPGITGWAAVNGRNLPSWEERLAMDVWYADHASVALDLRIMVRSLGVVLSRRGVSQPGSPTVAPFRGQPDGSLRADADEPIG